MLKSSVFLFFLIFFEGATDAEGSENSGFAAFFDHSRSPFSACIKFLDRDIIASTDIACGSFRRSILSAFYKGIYSDENERTKTTSFEKARAEIADNKGLSSGVFSRRLSVCRGAGALYNSHGR